LSPNPIAKFLSTLQKHRVRALLMGGQACILYGAAEFSRNVDFTILATDRNLQHLQQALDELGAEPHYVPHLQREALLLCDLRSAILSPAAFIPCNRITPASS
jgi:hypothetical protein